MNRNYSILCVIPSPQDATSFYRAVGPLSHLRKRYNISLMLGDSIDWVKVAMCDMVFIQRPYSPAEAKLCRIFKTMNKPIWMDFDDDLFSIPSDNPCLSTYGTKSNQQAIGECLELADVVSVSTEVLKQKYIRFNKNIRVIPNALNFDLFSHYCEPGKLPDEQNNVIMWRGSQTHHKDVMTVAPEIIEFAQHDKDIHFEFIGDRLWFLTDRLDRDRTHLTGVMDPIVYHQYIYRCAPKIFIVPLCDHEFNRSKSNIAWLEATFAGAVTIAPRMPEWTKPGVQTYDPNKKGDFLKVLKEVNNLNKSIRDSFVRDSWAHIMEYYTLDAVNHKRFKIIEALCNVGSATI